MLTPFDQEDDPTLKTKQAMMIAPPSTAKPGLSLPGIGPSVSSVQPANQQLGADKQELQRLESTGSGVSQLQRSHPKLGLLARVADVAGSIIAPGAAAFIPGTTLHHNALVNKQRGNVAEDATEQQREALAQQEQAKAQALVNPPKKQPTNAFELWQQQNPQGTVDDWNKIQQQYSSPKTPLIHETDQGIFLVDPETRQATPLTFNGQPLKPKPQAGNFEQKEYDEWHQTNPQGTMMDFEKQRNAYTAKPPVVNVNQQSARADKSYQYNAGVLDKVGQPIEQAVQRMGRLRDTLAQGSPQADALVAPELLTVMAGGQGSGLRMNEAEISRIVGGRSNWETLKASVNKWSLDPAQANSITPAQRQQIHSLVEHVNQKLIAKQKLLDDARNQLLNTEDPHEHRNIVNKARQAMTQIDEGVQQQQQQGGGMTIHRDPVTNRIIGVE
jgi:hypothetical protein